MAIYKVGVELTASTKKFDRELDKYTTKLDKLNRVEKQRLSTSKQMERQSRRMEDSMRRQTAMSKRGGGMLGRLGGFAGMARMAGVAGVAYGAFNTVSSAVKGSIGYEAQRTQIENMLGKNLGKKDISAIHAISGSTGQGKNEVYSAIYDYLSTYGPDLKGAIGSVSQNALLATGGAANLSDVQKAAITIKKAYENLSNEDVSKLIAGGVQAGRTTVSGVAGTVGEFMPIASQQGINALDAMSAYAATTQALGDDRKGATAIKSLFTKIGFTSKTGVTQEDLKTKSFADNIQTLNKTMESLIKRGKASGDLEAATMMLGNEEAVKAFLALKDPAKIEEAKRIAQTASPSEMAKRSLDDVSVQTQMLSENFSTLTDNILRTTGIVTGLSDSFAFLNKLFSSKGRQQIADDISGANTTVIEGGSYIDPITGQKKGIFGSDSEQVDGPSMNLNDKSGKALIGTAIKGMLNDFAYDLTDKEKEMVTDRAMELVESAKKNNTDISEAVKTAAQEMAKEFKTKLDEVGPASNQKERVGSFDESGALILGDNF